METDKKTRKVSYSQYSMWLNCPQEWKLAYVDKLRSDEPSIHLFFGRAIHEAIQTWLNILYTEDKHKAKIFDMEELFKDKLVENFKAHIKIDDNGQKTFPCDQETLTEFYLDGCEILKYIRSKHKDFFPTKGHELIGCEVPLNLEVLPNVAYVGYIDIVIKDKKTNKVYIYDLKTSTKGWNYEKKDPKKINQVLLYKHFYSVLLDVPQDLIEVKFIILKRKLIENNPWVKRVTAFEPAHGKRSVDKAVASFNEFLEVFDENGDVRLNAIKPTPSKNACRFCQFNNNKELCSVSYYLE